MTPLLFFMWLILSWLAWACLKVCLRQLKVRLRHGVMVAGPDPVLFHVAEPDGRHPLVTPRRGLVGGGRAKGGRHGLDLRLPGLGYRCHRAVRGPPDTLYRRPARPLPPGQLLVPFPQLGRALPDFLDPQSRAIE